MAFLGFFDILILALSLGILLLITVPLSGTLVRFRANYNPKGLQLDAEGGAQPHTGPLVTSYFGMMRRVYSIEGLAGLYKGFMPTLLSALALTLFAVILLGESPSSPRRTGSYHGPSASIIPTLVYSIFDMLVSLPAVVITYRSVTTPHKLPWFQPMHSLRVLLTPTERRKPWILYLTPGLLLTQAVHIAYVVVLMRPLGRWFLPRQEGSAVPEFSAWRLALYFALVLLSTGILTPLEVIATRLAIQRNHASPEFNSVSQEEEGDAEDVAEYAGAEEDVIGMRSEKDPYMGMVDCAKRMVDEEGWGALYRAWWLTFLGGLGAAGSP
ncbi:mitochondrial carrier [Heliocybe sulcata]|uniref:Mitochondrial carrier n=1 Tax=Heliocybe sulcata TaxID=5364 RepID=A0A5C3NAX7_9AGAM|nr:mitochondrial carrier [Heliocybe sulcata]